MPSMKDFEQLVADSFSDKMEYERLKVGAEFAARLIKARLNRNMTQAELATKAGLRQSAIARIENNGSLPRIDTVMKIAEALGIELSFFSNKSQGDLLEKTAFDSKFEILMNCIRQMQIEIAELKDVVKKQKQQVIIHHYINRNTLNTQSNDYGVTNYRTRKEENLKSPLEFEFLS